MVSDTERRGAVRLEPMTPLSTPAVVALFAQAIDFDPGYAPTVTNGQESVAEWFAKKRPDWSRVVASRNRVVGHVAVSKRAAGPTNELPPPELQWELNRLVVCPNMRRQAVASELVRAAERTFGNTLWASCVEGSDSNALFSSRRWESLGETCFADDPAPGLIFRFTDDHEQGTAMSDAEYRVQFVISRRLPGEDDFTEMGFGSSAAWNSVDEASHEAASAIAAREWTPAPDMPEPEDVDQ